MWRPWDLLFGDSKKTFGLGWNCGRWSALRNGVWEAAGADPSSPLDHGKEFTSQHAHLTHPLSKFTIMCKSGLCWRVQKDKVIHKDQTEMHSTIFNGASWSLQYTQSAEGAQRRLWSLRKSRQALRRSALTNERWVVFSTQRQGEWWGRINMPSNSSMTWVSLTTSGTQMVCDGESPQSSPWLFLETLLHSTSIYIGHYLSVLSLC